MTRYTKTDLRRVAREAGFKEVGQGRWGPCPLCKEYELKVTGKAGASFLYCGRFYTERSGGKSRTILCQFGASLYVLRAHMRRGWRVGMPFPLTKKDLTTETEEEE
jgi:hypothetical protein